MSSPTIDASTLENRIRISVQSRDIESAVLELSYLPPVYVNAKEIVFITGQTHSDTLSAMFEVHGLPLVLQHLTVSSYRILQKYIGCLLDFTTSLSISEIIYVKLKIVIHFHAINTSR